MVLDSSDLDPRILQGRDGGLATRTSTFNPDFFAPEAASSAARVAANGVLLRDPLNPMVPADCRHKVSPLVSVMVISVLLNDALM